MITTQLLRPESIVVVGASNNVHKPGGAILKNLINGGYRGELRAVNPKEKEVQGGILSVTSPEVVVRLRL